MEIPAPHPRESERLAALHALQLLDTPEEPRFEALTRTACRLFGVPTALITLVDTERQWFKSRRGLGLAETPRAISFCAHAILEPGPLVVEDARQDPRFRDNPLVTGDLGLRFYAGVPLRSPEGLPYGTLCLIDVAPRSFPPEQVEALEDLALLAEAELRATQADSRAQLEALLTAMGEGFILYGPEGEVQACNTAAEQILGLPRDHLLGRPLAELPWGAVHEDGRPWPREDHPALRALRSGEAEVNRVMGLRGPEGQPTWVLVNARALGGPSGRPRGAVSVFLDITRRKEAESRYRAVTDNVPGVMYQFQTWPDGRVAFPFVSPGVERLYGLAPRAWQADPRWALEALLEEDRPSYDAAFQAAQASLGTFQWEGRTRTTRPGEVLWIQLHSQPTPQVDGSVLWDGLVTDITALKRQEEALARQSAFQESLLQSAQVAIISTDLEGLVTSFNAHAEALLGWPAAEVVGRASPALWHDPREVAARAQALSRELERPVTPGFEVFVARARLGGTDQREWTFLTREGGRIPVLLAVSGIRDATDTLVGFLGIASDLRELKAREEALRTSERRFRHLVSSVPGVVFEGTRSPEGEIRLVFISDFSQELLGLPPQEALGDPSRHQDLIHPEDLPSFLDTSRRAAATESLFDWVGRVRPRTGGTRWVRMQGHPTPGPGGGTTWTGLVLDLTDRIKNELALRDAEERWSLALRANNDGIWDMNVETGEAWFSPRYYTMLGYEPEAFPGSFEAWKQQCHPEDLPDTLAQIESYVEGRTPTYQMIFRMRHRSGTWRWILSRGVGRRGLDGRIVRIVGSHADITQQREAEEALQASQARSQALVQALPDHIFLVHRDGTLLEVHTHDEEALRRPKTQLVGRNLRELLPPAEAEDRMTRIQRVLQTGQSETSETQTPTHRGTLDYEFRIVPCADDAVLLIARDITERKALDRLKSDFISTVSHELRTPLTSIKGALGLLVGGVTGDLPAKAQSLAQLALENANRLARLIDDLLDLAKAENAQLRLVMAPSDLHRLLVQALESVTPFAQSLQVELAYSPEVPEAPVNVDGDRMIQVILNLLSNGVKYSSPGSRVTARLGPCPRGWALEVENHGPPIPEAFRARIFQKFAMADGSDTRARGGTGLGLAISKTLLERMGGTIDFSSVADRTVFRIEVPRLGEAP